jgi:SAM-dependent methyltransferase
MKSDARILDLGCGTGAVTRRMLERLPDARVTAVDPSAQMRDLCAQRFGEDGRVEIMEGSGVSLPVGDGACDCVTSNLALHHLPHEDKAACARELARVLAIGGKFVYGDHFTDVEGAPRDPARCRDIIEKTVGWALFALGGGGYDQMLGLLRVLPLCLAEDGASILRRPLAGGSFLKTKASAISRCSKCHPSASASRYLSPHASDKATSAIPQHLTHHAEHQHPLLSRRAPRRCHNTKRRGPKAAPHY